MLPELRHLIFDDRLQGAVDHHSRVIIPLLNPRRLDGLLEVRDDLLAGQVFALADRLHHRVQIVRREEVLEFVALAEFPSRLLDLHPLGMIYFATGGNAVLRHVPLGRDECADLSPEIEEVFIHQILGIIPQILLQRLSLYLDESCYAGQILGKALRPIFTLPLLGLPRLGLLLRGLGLLDLRLLLDLLFLDLLFLDLRLLQFPAEAGNAVEGLHVLDKINSVLLRLVDQPLIAVLPLLGAFRSQRLHEAGMQVAQCHVCMFCYRFL